MSNPSRIFRPSLLLLMLSAAFLAEQVKAGQFDGLYVGMSKTQEEQNKKTWQEFYPGLEAEINDAFKQAQKTGTFLFESNKVPIAWNVTESNNIEVNSIFAGYFISRNVPPLNIYPLFPGLTVESQNISIRAGNDLIVSPIEKQQEGFGYAFHVGPDQTATLTAGDKIIFNAPRITGDFSTQDENSILMGYKSKAQLSAKSIMIFGGMSALSGSHTKISAQKGIYFLVPYERSGGSRAPIALENAELHLYAPDILIQRSVKLGYFIHDKQQPGFLKIGHHKSATKQTNNVFIDGPVSILYESQLQIDAKKTVVFNDLLDISRDAQAQVKANKINIEKLKVGHTFAGSGDSSQVNFSVTDNGTMIIHEGANVTGGSNLNINLGQNAGLLGAFQKDDKSQINISMGSDSYWKAPQSSSVSEISVSPSSYIQLGETGQSISITTDRYTGSGSVLYLPSGSASSLTIAQDSEGSHKVLLDSTGKNLRDTKYIYHIVVDEDSPLENRKAFFALANNGIVDAGPYEYKLGLYQFKRNKDKLWVILAQQNQKHPPIDPPTPVLPDEPLPPSEEEDLPDLPFNPDSPPLEDISLIKPVGLSPAGKLVLASVSSGTQVMQFLGTTDELRSRMGEIRDGGGYGPYVLYRYDRSRLESYSSVRSKLSYNAFNFGFDNKLTSNWILGANLSFSEGKMKLEGADGSKTRISSLGLVAYSTWFTDSGSYLDAVATINRYKNKLNIQTLDEDTAKAEFNNYGAGFSLEAGHRFLFNIGSKNHEWFIEPQAQLAYYFAKGNNFQVTNGMQVRLKDANSLSGRLGLNLGHNFLDSEGNRSGQIYIRGGVRHEFLGKSKVHMNEFAFQTDSLGTRAYYGIGGEAVLKNRIKIFGQINRETGSKLKTDFQVRAGIKYIF